MTAKVYNNGHCVCLGRVKNGESGLAGLCKKHSYKLHRIGFTYGPLPRRVRALDEGYAEALEVLFEFILIHQLPDRPRSAT